MLLVTYASADEYMADVPQLLTGWRGPVYIEILPPEMTWTRVCSHKPVLIQRACRMYSGCVVYLDADARIKTPFGPEEVEAALAGRTFGVRYHPESLGTGTILIDSRHKDCAEWLMRWRLACEARPDCKMADQANLGRLAVHWEHAHLGPEWAWLEPQASHKNPPTPPDPVYVWHMQRSRQMAMKKGGRGKG